MKFSSSSLSILATLVAVEGFAAPPSLYGSVTKRHGQNYQSLIPTKLSSSSFSREEESSINGRIVGKTTKTSGSDQTMVGGHVSVDMDKYNLPLEQAAEEWTANLVAESTTMAEGIYLGAQNPNTNFADTVKIPPIARIPGQGLGMELLELAGGRDDGVGITIVSALVKGGTSEGSGVLPGDSIVKIAVMKGDDEIASIDTECKNWDATVEAIGSLPVVEEDGQQQLILTVKRLRRKPKVTVHFQYPPDQGEEDTTIELFSGENLRRAMLVRGIKLNDPLATRFDSGGTGDCGAEGTCATCAVAVMDGLDLLNQPGQTEQGIFKAHPRRRLACRAIVGHGMQEGSMTVRVNPRQWEN